MGSLLRKLKAALTIGTGWGFVFGACGALLGSLFNTTGFLSSPLGLGIVMGATGLIFGTGFSGLLALMEGRKTLDQLTPRRASLWGWLVGSVVAVGGTVAAGNLLGLAAYAGELGIPLGIQLVAVATVATSYGAVAAGLAAATVSLAKRHPAEPLPAAIPEMMELPIGGSPEAER